jgi:N utilization substance protein A
VDIGRTVGVLFPEEQIHGEYYRIGQRLRVLILQVQKDSRGPSVILSRASHGMIKKLFELEVPEIAAGSVEIKSVAREAGSRSKIAVVSLEDGVDPIGSCVGQKGTRVQAVINELGGEKIDIIEWSDNPAKFIANAMAPAKVLDVETHEKDRIARVQVPEEQLSLAIGKKGQNVRLAAKLTEWKIDVAGAKVGDLEEKESGEEETKVGGTKEAAKAETKGEEKEKKTEEKKEKKTGKTKKKKEG